LRGGEGGGSGGCGGVGGGGYVGCWLAASEAVYNLFDFKNLHDKNYVVSVTVT